MTTISRKQIEDLKSEGKYHEAGARLAQRDWTVRAPLRGGRNDYGPHYGLASTRDAAIAEFQSGYDVMKLRLERSDMDAGDFLHDY